MNKLYFHFGLHKTATSSLQLTAKQHIEELDTQGYNYPLFSTCNGGCRNIANHSHPLFSLFSKSPNLFSENIYASIEDIDANNEHFSNQLRQCLQSNKHIILSAEETSFLSPKELREMLHFLKQNKHEIIPFAFVRDPLSYHRSTIQQQIRDGRPTTISSYKSQRNAILHLLSVFGSKMHWFKFEDACAHAHGPAIFMLEVMGIDCNNIQAVKQNASASNLNIRVQNILNQLEARIDADNNDLNPKHRSIDPIFDDRFALRLDEYELIKQDINKDRKMINILLQQKHQQELNERFENAIILPPNFPPLVILVTITATILLCRISLSRQPQISFEDVYNFCRAQPKFCSQNLPVSGASATAFINNLEVKTSNKTKMADLRLNLIEHLQLALKHAQISSQTIKLIMGIARDYAAAKANHMPAHKAQENATSQL